VNTRERAHVQTDIIEINMRTMTARRRTAACLPDYI
jgi:hypothetical protein